MADLIIKDVCSVCNSGPLSALDAYGAQLYDDFFTRFKTDNTTLEFTYDYLALAKWLLKLSYNSARAVASDSDRLGMYKAAIIDPSAPLPEDFIIIADLVLPSALTAAQAMIPPESNRICAVKVRGADGNWCTIRLVAINSYYFYIVLQDTMKLDPGQVLTVINRIPGTRLDASASHAILVPSGETTHTVHEEWARTLQDGKVKWPRGG